MKYVISDIHGCYEEFTELLEKIHFSEEDDLYILGDSCDRGPEPMKVLLDLMERPNVTYIIGNHDYMMLKMLTAMSKELTAGDSLEELLEDYLVWREDGGQVTCDQFAKLDKDTREDVLDYLSDAYIYEEVQANGKKFVLVHGGIHGFEVGKSLEDYDFSDFIFYRADYSRRYFSDDNTFLVTGHTPTMKIRTDRKPLIYEENGHIAIDCGCVYGGRLAAYCLDNGEVTYVDAGDKR